MFKRMTGCRVFGRYPQAAHQRPGEPCWLSSKRQFRQTSRNPNLPFMAPGGNWGCVRVWSKKGARKAFRKGWSTESQHKICLTRGRDKEALLCSTRSLPVGRPLRRARLRGNLSPDLSKAPSPLERPRMENDSRYPKVTCNDPGWLRNCRTIAQKLPAKPSRHGSRAEFRPKFEKTLTEIGKMLANIGQRGPAEVRPTVVPHFGQG